MNHHHIQIPEHINTPAQLYDFFYSTYSNEEEWSKEKLLELMRESVTDDQHTNLEKRTRDELAEIYCHGMVAGYFVCGVCNPSEEAAE